jgi:hypothetical protein
LQLPDVRVASHRLVCEREIQYRSAAWPPGEPSDPNSRLQSMVFAAMNGNPSAE